MPRANRDRRPTNQPADDHDDRKPAREDRGDGEGREGTAQAQLAIQHALVKHIIDPINYSLPTQPPESLLFEAGEGGTENYRAEGKTIGWVWNSMALGGDHPNTRKWHDELLTYLRGERHEFMGAEQCAPDPHFAMHLAAHGVAHLYASKYGVADVLADTTWWFSSLFGIAAQCSTSTRVVVPCCNSRTEVPSQIVWSTLWDARRGRGGPSLEKLGRDRTLAGYWAMIQPKSSLANIPIGAIPRMRCPLNVERVPGGYIATIGQPTQGDVDRRWVCSRVEVRDGALVGVEKNWGA